MKAFDLDFKVRIKNVYERAKVVRHLKKLGLYYPDDGFDTICGILVGNAYIGEVYHECAFTDSPKEEISVDEVLKIQVDDEV